MSTYSVSNYASALRNIGRVSQVRANDVAARTDARVGLRSDGVITRNEIIDFQAGIQRGGQGLTLTDRRLVAASTALFNASVSAADRYAYVPVNRTAPAPGAVRVASLSGNVQVRAVTGPRAGQVILEMSRRQLAQRIAGPGATELKLTDFASASRFLTRNEIILAGQLAQESLLAQPLGRSSVQGRTPGGRAVTIDSEFRGTADGLGGTFTYRTSQTNTVSIKTGTGAVLLDEKTGTTYAPNAAGVVTLPGLPGGELTLISRGVNAKILESFWLVS
ncbi:MAG: hypothetical protein Q8L48_09685 [Archangium sp.]|nr:hypothetical protein [Archangium sp.]